jgi:mono/diheme cytochrome c family protein
MPAKQAAVWSSRALAFLVAFCVCGSATAQPPDKKIERLWKSKCASCHGADGKGDTDQGKKMKIGNMATASFQKGKTDAQLTDAILNGVKTEKDGVKKEMDPYKDELSPEQVKALVQFIRAFPTS